MKICLLASGSSGNCIFVASTDTAILIDAGISVTQIIERLNAIGVNAESIDALLITHEHIDHCREAGNLSCELDCPIYTNERTLSAIRGYLSGDEEIRLFKTNEGFSIKAFFIQPFRVFHDAVDPCGFTISDGRAKLGVATDLGVVTDPVKQHLKECDVVILEANHDLDMLINGSYPWDLKQRIRSEVGHLSNGACGKALAEIAKAGRLKKAFLAHLSANNNTPELALSTVQSYLNSCQNAVELLLTYRDQISSVIEL